MRCFGTKKNDIGVRFNNDGWELRLVVSKKPQCVCSITMGSGGGGV